MLCFYALKSSVSITCIQRVYQYCCYSYLMTVVSAAVGFTQHPYWPGRLITELAFWHPFCFTFSVFLINGPLTLFTIHCWTELSVWSSSSSSPPMFRIQILHIHKKKILKIKITFVIAYHQHNSSTFLIISITKIRFFAIWDFLSNVVVGCVDKQETKKGHFSIKMPRAEWE